MPLLRSVQNTQRNLQEEHESMSGLPQDELIARQPGLWLRWSGLHKLPGVVVRLSQDA